MFCKIIKYNWNAFKFKIKYANVKSTGNVNTIVKCFNEMILGLIFVFNKYVYYCIRPKVMEYYKITIVGGF